MRPFCASKMAIVNVGFEFARGRMSMIHEDQERCYTFNLLYDHIKVLQANE